MPLPSKVREQGEEAERLAREHREQVEKQAKANAEPPKSADPPREEGTPDEPTPAVPTTSTKGLTDQDAEYWKRRFVGFKRDHDETVSEMRAEISRLTTLVGELQGSLSGQGQPASGPVPRVQTAQSGVTEDDVLSVLTPEQREEFSPELLRLIGAAGRHSAELAYNRAVEGLNSQVSDRLSRVEQMSAKTAEERFQDQIEASIPNWRELHEEDAFREWIHSFDPILGEKRFDFVNRCMQNLDAPRIIAMYQSYTNQKAARPTREPVVEQEDPLAHRVTPQGGADGGGAPAPKGRIYTVAEVNQIYRDIAIGKISGDEAEQLEQDIWKAQNEGRVRG